MSDGMFKTSVTLSDFDLAKLIESTEPEVRAAAEQAGRRLTAPSRWPNIPSRVAPLVVDIIAEGKTKGRLIYRGVSFSSCKYCGAKSTWEKKRRKTYEAKIPGVEFADRFVIVTGHISVGACRQCVESALPVLRSELATFPVQLPPALQTDDAPAYRRWGLVRCKDCGWSGHEGQLGKLRTLMGDGWYPGKCPSCGAEQRFMGRDPFERPDGFEIAEVAP